MGLSQEAFELLQLGVGALEGEALGALLGAS
jgi:hypothetical protein